MQMRGLTANRTAYGSPKADGQRRQRPLGVGDPRQPTAKRQGLSRLQIDAAIRSQDGLCAVGGELLGDLYAIDHCHGCASLHGHDPARGCPRCFRGVVCLRHNSALGALGDDAEGLRHAAEYVAHGRH